MELKIRKKERLNTGWRFQKGNLSGAHRSSFDDSDWRRLNVPHDWSIEEPFDKDMPFGSMQGYLPRWTVGWYRKHFTVDAGDRGKRVVIQFDGVHHNSEVWLNGHFIGKRPYGYVSFQYDLTPYLSYERENVLAVKVDNTVMPSDRWYSGSGIYRNVWLIAADPLHVAQWGTAIFAKNISKDEATLSIRTAVHNQYRQSKTCTVVTEILDDTGAVLGEVTSAATVEAEETREVDQCFRLEKPELWSPDRPKLYAAKTILYCDGRPVDDYVTPFGVRDIQLDPREGLSINGTPTKLKGVCIHHDLGCLGAAFYLHAMKRRLRVLKGMGCNAIRFAHNPMAPELLDLCDQMGFLVVNEAFDKWKSLYYEELFDEWWKEDLSATVLRDRNHPCVLMWSVGNEVEEQGQPAMLQRLKMLTDYCRELDPTRPVTCALEPHNSPPRLRDAPVEDKVEHTKKIAEHVDVLGLNYQEQWYESYRKAMPHMLIVGTETFPFYRGRGNRVKGFEPVNPWFDVEKHDYVVGQFVWVGIDYLGEAHDPWKGWPFGLVDTCGFRKPISYLHQSFWSDDPFVQMAVFDADREESCPAWKQHWKSPPFSSHWTFPHLEGKMLRMVTFTNCESVELKVNGESYGEKRLADFSDRMIVWHLPYSPGTVKAIGKKDGRVLCAHELKTAGRRARLAMKADRTRIAADGYDLVHVEVAVTDAEGITVPSAECEICFRVEGEGEMIGVDNGNLSSDEPYKGERRRTYLGRCLAVVRSTSRAGDIRLTATSGPLTESVTIKSEAGAEKTAHV